MKLLLPVGNEGGGGHYHEGTCLLALLDQVCHQGNHLYGIVHIVCGLFCCEEQCYDCHRVEFLQYLQLGSQKTWHG